METKSTTAHRHKKAVTSRDRIVHRLLPRRGSVILCLLLYGRGLGAAWHLQHVEVSKEGRLSEPATIFLADRWLDQKNGTTAELVPSTTAGAQVPQQYKVRHIN